MPSAQVRQLALGEPGADMTVAQFDEWSLLPTETELYILPNGQVVIADMPVELQPLLASLGRVTPCEINPLPRHD